MISKNCFFIAMNNSLICWDFKNHKQYELSRDHADRLIHLIYEKDHKESNDDLTADLKRCNVFMDDADDNSDWGWDVLSRIFHYGTKDIPIENHPSSEEEWALQYLEHCNSVLNKNIQPDNSRTSESGISLPIPRSTFAVDKAFKNRATVRDFQRIPISLADLAEILHHTLGFIGSRTINYVKEEENEYSRRRATPSVGGLNATEGYVYVNNVDSLEAGIYYYDPRRHELHWRSPLPCALGDLLSGQHFANDIPAGLFLSSRFDKLWWKYEHSRAYRMALIEVGHAAQTFQLAATDRGMNTWLTGALNETSIEPLLMFDNPSEHVLFFVACGYSNGNATPRSLRALIS